MLILPHWLKQLLPKLPRMAPKLRDLGGHEGDRMRGPGASVTGRRPARQRVFLVKERAVSKRPKNGSSFFVCLRLSSIMLRDCLMLFEDSFEGVLILFFAPGSSDKILMQSCCSHAVMVYKQSLDHLSRLPIASRGVGRRSRRS